MVDEGFQELEYVDELLAGDVSQRPVEMHAVGEEAAAQGVQAAGLHAGEGDGLDGGFI